MLPNPDPTSSNKTTKMWCCSICGAIANQQNVVLFKTTKMWMPLESDAAIQFMCVYSKLSSIIYVQMLSGLMLTQALQGATFPAERCKTDENVCINLLP